MKLYDSETKTLYTRVGTFTDNSVRHDLYVPIIVNGLPATPSSSEIQTLTIEQLQEFKDYSHKTLKQLLMEFADLQESDFNNHESDLYVVYKDHLTSQYIYSLNTPLVIQFGSRCKISRHEGAKGTPWELNDFYDVPFGYMVEHMGQRIKKKC